MKKLCDLHTHSYFSDGTCSPEQIIDEAIRQRIGAVALTDHNNVDGLQRFLQYAEGKDIEAIAGTEFSVDYEGSELHLLGLFLPISSFDKISELMTEVRERKEKSNTDLISALASDGIILDYAAIKAGTPKGSVNRAHVAAELMRRGYSQSISEAFEKFLSKDGPYYKEAKKPDVFQMIEFIDSIGALPVLAHPFFNLSAPELISFLEKAKNTALAGLECYYSTYDEEQTELSLKIAKEFSLLASGGSDFHGTNKPDISLGSGYGRLCVPYSCKTELEKLAATRSKRLNK